VTYQLHFQCVPLERNSAKNYSPPPAPFFLEHANLKNKGDIPASAGFAKSTHMCVLFASPSLHVMATSALKYRSCVTDLLIICRRVLTKESGTGTPCLDSGSNDS